MAKITNTGNQPLFIGKTQVPAHGTVDVPDDELAEAKKGKMVEAWFGNGTLKSGEGAEKEEAGRKDQPQSGASIHPNEPKNVPGSGTRFGSGNPGQSDKDDDEKT